jgi:asparagine N-glycosylation enzyme membrane subunit Stt3
MTSPYINAPLNPPARPRMFNSVIAKVIWTLVPIVSLGLAAAVPLVVAAEKGVVKPWLAIAYVVGELVLVGAALAIDPNGDNGNPIAGFLLVIVIVTAATHTALLDSDKVTLGK